MKIDLNSDLGESFGNYHMGNDNEIMEYITSANVACGFHAGDPLVIKKTIELAIKKNVSIGAHPGYPDLAGFGRRHMKLSFDEIKTSVMYQVGALKSMAEALGTKIHHVKPHGALYNDAAKDRMIAKAVCEAVQLIDENLIFVGLANSLMLDEAQKAGLKTASEVFADRAYNDDGSLVSRNVEGAVIHNVDFVLQRIVEMIKTNSVDSINGKRIQIKPDTICVHGDNAEAINMVKQISFVLEKESISKVNLVNL